MFDYKHTSDDRSSGQRDKRYCHATGCSQYTFTVKVWFKESFRYITGQSRASTAPSLSYGNVRFSGTCRKQLFAPSKWNFAFFITSARSPIIPQMVMYSTYSLKFLSNGSTDKTAGAICSHNESNNAAGPNKVLARGHAFTKLYLGSKSPKKLFRPKLLGFQPNVLPQIFLNRKR